LNLFCGENKKYEEVYVYERDFDNIHNAFPNDEDFSYLLDYKKIDIGDKIYLENGVYIITEIKSGFRNEGFYDYVEWCDNLTCKISKIKYSSHNITKIKVDGMKRYIVWEDYNYQQSYLYKKNMKSYEKNICK